MRQESVTNAGKDVNESVTIETPGAKMQTTNFTKTN